MGQRALLSGYCIDTSSLIDLWRRHYPPDVFQTLWEKDIEALIFQGEIIAPQEVFNELKQKDDELFKWVKKHKKILWIWIMDN